MKKPKLTKTITGTYTTTDADCGYRIICNSATPFTISLHTATGKYEFDLEIDNIGVGTVTCGGQSIPQNSHAHVGNNGGTSWVVVVGASGVGIPVGGTTGQILRKISNADYDMSWMNETDNSLNIKTLLKDILRIKLRQTGLNLDPNAWSDDISDTTGINTGLSSGYYFDSTNKSFKAIVNSNLKYECNEVPNLSSPAWTNQSTGGTASVNAGILTLSAGAGYKQQYYISASYFPAKTKRSVVRCKPVSGAQVTICNIEDGVKDGGLHLDCARQTIWYWNGSAVVDVATGKNYTDNYHLFEAEFDNANGLKLWVDTVLICTIPYASLGGTATNGSVMICSQSTGNFDYWYVYPDITATNDGTIIWKAQTSEGTLVNAVVEATVNLGTGTIAYYISRDGGTTFTQCTLDSATGITSQPSGTFIVLKVVITGNAELFAVAWGGSV